MNSQKETKQTKFHVFDCFCSDDFALAILENKVRGEIYWVALS